MLPRVTKNHPIFATLLFSLEARTSRLTPELTGTCTRTAALRQQRKVRVKCPVQQFVMRRAHYAADTVSLTPKLWSTFRTVS